jgi:hypothetical protein
VPFCVDLSRGDLKKTYHEACKRGFDHLPVRDSDGMIRRVVPTAALANVDSWEGAERHAAPLNADLLIARDAPAFSLLERLAHGSGDVLFCLGRDGVDGVVTVFDLNQPAAHLLGFGLVLICEAEVTRVVRQHLGEDPETAKQRVEAGLTHRPIGIKRWERARQVNTELHLASSLTFGEKCELLPEYGLPDLAERLGVDEEQLMEELLAIKELRDALAHYDDADRLAHPEWVHARMRRAHVLAQQLARTQTVS